MSFIVQRKFAAPFIKNLNCFTVLTQSLAKFSNSLESIILIMSLSFHWKALFHSASFSFVSQSMESNALVALQEIPF